MFIMERSTSILTKLFNGEICPAEKFYPKTEEYRQTHQSFCENYEAFSELLRKTDPSLHRRFLELADKQADLTSMECCQMFTEGYKLGTKFMLEILNEN